MEVPKTTVEQKQRHGCLTAWLILMIVAGSVTVLLYLLDGHLVQQAFPAAPGWFSSVMAVFTIFNLVCVIALFRWKKWGFWGLLISYIISATVNLSIGIAVRESVLGLLGIVFLYAVLHIGKENKGWPQLD